MDSSSEHLLCRRPHPAYHRNDDILLTPRRGRDDVPVVSLSPARGSCRRRAYYQEHRRDPHCMSPMSSPPLLAAPGPFSPGSGTADTEGGVFVSTRSLLKNLEDAGVGGKTDDHHDSNTTCSSTTVCSATDHTADEAAWTSSGSFRHHRGSPLFVTNPDLPDVQDKARALGAILARSRQLPKLLLLETDQETGHFVPVMNAFSSNHVMVNEERTKRKMAPLVRLSELDAIARSHAEVMAAQTKLFHPNPLQVHMTLNRTTTRRLGANVARGISLLEIHKTMMMETGDKTRADKNNILDRRFCNFGMASVRSQQDGLLYLCQVFRG